ncbi:hypothetical protein T4A_14263 [Trichinella pseudospiralis]|uniref:Uncharacterized protein n=1 Tax=Trichinella pseudospiralis TaxID=6337 RepID=A0A0V1DJ29_TRIPS|nr:hypothetical protein T4A_14263 [Trichinella pseudospiralis]
MNSLPMLLRGCHKVITEPYLCGFPYHKEESPFGDSTVIVYVIIENCISNVCHLCFYLCSF